jgi:hypothetical protein
MTDDQIRYKINKCIEEQRQSEIKEPKFQKFVIAIKLPIRFIKWWWGEVKKDMKF